ncbi:LysR family transcriptional regulator [Burkholderiales bacterium 8X]|nr:LysR family transcriptional regulator [Burkholderiales bacterium 8X]
MGQTDIRSIDLAMLRTFDALLRERSVSRAAARLFLSQPAVSASLKRLREAFGDPLFTRAPHGIVPTARALALAPRLDAVLLELQQLLNAGAPFDPAKSDRILRIAGSDHTSRTLLPALCRLLGEAGSRMRLSWELADYGLLSGRLRRGDVDIGLLPRTVPVSGVESTLLYEDAYVVVSRRGRRNAAARMDLDVFCDAPHAVLSQSRSMLDDSIDQILARAGRRRHIQVAVTSFSQMVDLLAEGEMVAVIPQRVASWYAKQLQAAPLPFELPRYRLYLCWDPRSNADDAVLWLKDRILELGKAPALGIAGSPGAPAEAGAVSPDPRYLPATG